MSAMDELASTQFGVPSMTLMENAGMRVASVAREMVGATAEIAIVCGKGNNGGDGLVAARLLHQSGRAVQLYVLGSLEELKADPLANLEKARKAGVPVTTVTSEDELAGFRRRISRCALVVDAILGTGFTPPARGLPAAAIRLVDGLDIPVLAVDIPSGLSSDSGVVPDHCVRAAATVTFGLPKIGQLLYPASACCGRLLLADIGFPAALVEQVPASCFVTTSSSARALLGARAPDSHKGNYGHAVIVAGAAGMAGAAHLAARGALRGGSGLVTVALPGSLAGSLTAGLPEAMTLPLPESDTGALGDASHGPLLEFMAGKSVAAIGPGLTRHADTARLVRDLLPRLRVPAVVDANGLHALAAAPSVLLEAKTDIVLTPHPGEFGRLLGIPAAEVQANRVGLARDFSAQYGVVVVLKGAHSLVATPEGAVHISLTGNAGMAAGGMGDVLTGLIAALIAQGSAPRDAARLAVYLHGKAGDVAASRMGPRGFLAGEVADLLPEVVGDLLDGKSASGENGGDLRLILP